MNSQKQTLVITGSSGFVGEKLATKAMAEGFDVIGIDIKKSMNLDAKKILFWQLMQIFEQPHWYSRTQRNQMQSTFYLHLQSGSIQSAQKSLNKERAIT